MNIVFLGDSITDAGRNLESGCPQSIGQGYAMLVAAQLGAAHPTRDRFINVGVSGERIVDTYAQIKCRCWNNAPDVVSIYLGINDVLHEFFQSNGVDAVRFYNVYRMLLSDTRERFPGVQFILMTPFLLDGPYAEDRTEEKYAEVRLRTEAIEKLAGEFHCPVLHVQDLMDAACRCADSHFWSADGIHPTPAGHRLIADAWLEIFENKLFCSNYPG